MNFTKTVLFGVFLITTNLLAWQKDGVPIATGPGAQIEPRVVSLDTDLVVVYRTTLTPMTDELHAVKIDGKTGKVKWDVLVSEDTSLGYRAHQVIVNKDGMLWVTFERLRGWPPVIGLQKLDINGDRLLGKDGIDVSSNTQEKHSPQLCHDGSGEGCFVIWSDYRNPIVPFTWAARVTADGQVAWAAPTCTTATKGQYNPVAVKSGNGCIIFWGDWRDSLAGVYGQRFAEDSSQGQWGTNGKLIIPFHSSNVLSALDEHSYSDQVPYFFPYAIGDDREGAVVYNVFGYNDLWQRVDSSGNLLWNPPPDVPPAPSILNPYQSVSNRAAGVTGCWGNVRVDHSTVDVVQMDSSGHPTWGNSLRIWTGPFDEDMFSTYPTVADDYHHGAVITWVQSDYAINNLLITRVDSTGQVRWNPPKVICALPYGKDHPYIINGLNQGYIVVWEDARNGSWDLYAQYIDSTGQVGINEAAGRVPTPNECLLSIEPNPFSRTVEIRSEYREASSEGKVIKIYDVAGKLVKSFNLTIAARGEPNQSPITTGPFRSDITWDGRADSGEPVPPGVYFCRLETKGYQTTKKIVRIK